MCSVQTFWVFDGQIPAVGSKLGTPEGLFNDLFETKNVFIIIKEGRIHLFYKFYLWLSILQGLDRPDQPACLPPTFHSTLQKDIRPN